MKQYLVLSRGQWDADAAPQDVQRAIDAFYAWYDEQLALGRMLPGSRLAAGGKRVARASISDGPFAEAKELIGGYWFIVADSLDEAAALAARNPCMAYGLHYDVMPLEPDRARADTPMIETPPAWRR